MSTYRKLSAPVLATLALVLGLAAFFWALRSRQFDDPDGDAHRVLRTDFDDKPKS